MHCRKSILLVLICKVGEQFHCHLFGLNTLIVGLVLKAGVKKKVISVSFFFSILFLPMGLSQNSCKSSMVSQNPASDISKKISVPKQTEEYWRNSWFFHFWKVFK